MNKSKPINLITCMKFFKSVLNNATDFVENNDLKSLANIKTARSNYCQLQWMKGIVLDMQEKIETAIDVYDQKINPIIQDVTETIDEINDRSIYDMWDMNYYDGIDEKEYPDEVKDSWADTAEYDEARKHLKAMKTSGYPNVNNIRPIKELKSPTTEKVEEKFSKDFHPNEKKTTNAPETIYHTFEIDNCAINLPVVQSLTDILPCFHYYDGDRKHSPGIYMSPFQGVIMKIPFVRVISYSMENSNYFSMKCANGKLCKKISCSYSHPGTDYIKIGCVSRCPKAHSFGNHETLHEDIKSVNIEDIRIVSMYGLNDLFSAALWFSSKIHEPSFRVLTDLEVCDNYTDDEFMKSDEMRESDNFD